MKRIEITIDPQGSSHIETKGFAGSECLEASTFVEQALGKRLDTRTTSEFYQPAGIQQQELER